MFSKYDLTKSAGILQKSLQNSGNDLKLSSCQEIISQGLYKLPFNSLMQYLKPQNCKDNIQLKFPKILIVQTAGNINKGSLFKNIIKSRFNKNCYSSILIVVYYYLGKCLLVDILNY